MSSRVLVIVPFPLDEIGIANRREQLASCQIGPQVTFDYRPVKASCAYFDSYHDWLLADVGIFEAGLSAERDGYSAVCIDTMSDSGANPLRSVLTIPVIAPARASFATALMLGERFSILTQWDPWIATHRKTLREYKLEDRCASIRSINIEPDVKNLLGGKEEIVYPALLDAAQQCVDADGAEVICLGSTTMHQAHGFLATNLPVPVINPGPLTYKLAESMLGLGLSHSKRSYPAPRVGKENLLHAMLNAGAELGDGGTGRRRSG